MTDTKVVAFDASSGSVSREKLEQAVAAALDRKKEGKEQGVFLETHVGHVLPAKIPLKHPMPPSSDNKLLFIVGAEKEAVLKRLSKAGIRAASVIMINEIRKGWTPEREADLRSHDAIYADSSLFPKLWKIQKALNTCNRTHTLLGCVGAITQRMGFIASHLFSHISLSQQ
ncbi:hypothetical protein DFJ73DRAFT_271564 [Zopfochytrium polystomum]|nr:hypothetical protein DFJ73DRAFT_271564 [Zopfochytrium polystomum]